MSRIEDKILECVVYLYPSEAAAQDGQRFGGSGFLIGIPVGDGAVICVVSNRHVIDSGSMTVRLNTRDGQIDIIPLDQAQWFRHPDGDDIAICPIGLKTDFHKVRWVSTNMFLDKGTVEWANIGPGDDCFVVGRFISHEGKQQNLPTVRFGNIAQMPWEPILIEGFPQESFLVEARSIAGYSGSPVFVQIPPTPVLQGVQPDMMESWPGYAKRPHVPVPLGPWLMGIDYCHLCDWEKPRLDVSPNEPQKVDWHIRTNTGMMGVIPAWKLREIIDGPMKTHLEHANKAIEH